MKDVPGFAVMQAMWRLTPTGSVSRSPLATTGLPRGFSVVDLKPDTSVSSQRHPHRSAGGFDPSHDRPRQYQRKPVQPILQRGETHRWRPPEDAASATWSCARATRCRGSVGTVERRGRARAGECGIVATYAACPYLSTVAARVNTCINLGGGVWWKDLSGEAPGNLAGRREAHRLAIMRMP